MYANFTVVCGGAGRVGGGGTGRGAFSAVFLFIPAQSADSGGRSAGVPRETTAGIVNLFEAMQVRFTFFRTRVSAFKFSNKCANTQSYEYNAYILQFYYGCLLVLQERTIWVNIKVTKTNIKINNPYRYQQYTDKQIKQI